jgi:hypothetical protein
MLKQSNLFVHATSGWKWLTATSSLIPLHYGVDRRRYRNWLRALTLVLSCTESAAAPGRSLEKIVEDGKNGAQGRNRTTDTVIFSHVLYQLSYLGMAADHAEQRL